MLVLSAAQRAPLSLLFGSTCAAVSLYFETTHILHLIILIHAHVELRLKREQVSSLPAAQRRQHNHDWGSAAIAGARGWSDARAGASARRCRGEPSAGGVCEQRRETIF